MLSSNTHIAMSADGIELNSSGSPNPALQTLGTGSSLFLFLFALVFRLIYVIQSLDNQSNDVFILVNDSSTAACI